MVSNPGDYPYSSYSTYNSNKKGGLVHADLILGMMSQKRGVAQTPLFTVDTKEFCVIFPFSISS